MTATPEPGSRDDFEVLLALVDAVERGDHVLPPTLRRAQRHINARAAVAAAQPTGDGEADVRDPDEWCSDCGQKHSKCEGYSDDPEPYSGEACDCLNPMCPHRSSGTATGGGQVDEPEHTGSYCTPVCPPGCDRYATITPAPSVTPDSDQVRDEIIDSLVLHRVRGERLGLREATIITDRILAALAAPAAEDGTG